MRPGRPLFLALLACLCLAPARAGAARILIIGDSHTVGPFGAAMDKELRARGNDTALYAVCGASARWWLGPKRAPLSTCYSVHDYGGADSPRTGEPPAAPPMAGELLAGKPDLVIVALGSNPDGAGAAATLAAARQLVSLIPAGTRCVWIGPPPMPDRLDAVAAVVGALQGEFAATRACRFLDSGQWIKKENAAANNHFYGPPATSWGWSAANAAAP